MNQLLIEFLDAPVTLRNADIVEESLSLTESLCSDTDLRFGACESSVFGVRVLGAMLPIAGRKCKVSMTTGDETHVLGYFKVNSDKPTADRRYRDIVAYDALSDIITADVAAWYQGLSFPMTLKAFRNSFFNHFGIEQEEAELVNDGMTVKKTIEPEKLSGKTVITAICEINGVFGHIGRNGRFQYVELESIEHGLYPSNDLYPSDDLFPVEANTEKLTKSRYISCKYEEYIVPGITKLQIRQEENDIGSPVGSGDNGYVVQGNFLVYGKSAGELQTIAQNMLGKIGRISQYRPFTADTPGNLTREVGQPISLYTTYGVVTSYILSRTLTGIQALRDSLEASGSAERKEQVNGTQEQIVQLQAKTNKLTRNVDETRSELADTAAGLHSEIVQTAGAIRLEVAEAEAGLYSQILQNAQQIQLRVTAGEVVSLIDITVDGMTFTADQIKLEGYTTINGNFSIDTNGNLVITSGNTTMTVEGSYVKLSDGTNMLRFNTQAIRFNGSVDAWLARTTDGNLVIGDASVPVNIAGYPLTLNGAEAITSANIGNYLASLETRIAALEVKGV